MRKQASLEPTQPWSCLCRGIFFTDAPLKSQKATSDLRRSDIFTYTPKYSQGLSFCNYESLKGSYLYKAGVFSGLHFLMIYDKV